MLTPYFRNSDRDYRLFQYLFHVDQVFLIFQRVILLRSMLTLPQFMDYPNSFFFTFSFWGCEAKSPHVWLMDNTTDRESLINRSRQHPNPVFSCITLPMLGQFSSSTENFNSIYVFPNGFLMPERNNTIMVPDTYSLVTGFNVRYLSNSGGTLAISVTFNKPHMVS